MLKVALLLTCLVCAWHCARASDIAVVWSGVKNSSDCTLTFKDQHFRCTLGLNGVVPADIKTEGDGYTPAGAYPFRRSFYRADRVHNTSALVPLFFPMDVTRPDYGWCDDSADQAYNEFITLPYPGSSFEHLWLSDPAYDLFAVIGYNDAPAVPGKGSAIFFHVTETYSGTAGCVALSLVDLQWVLSRLDETTRIVVS